MVRSRQPRRKAITGRNRLLIVAGALLLVAGLVAFMGIITAEALYPAGYSTSQNEISDLGATRPPDSVIEEPSATIFNSVMIACGAFVILGALFLYSGFGRVVPPSALGLFGVGVLGVGVFPGNRGGIHAVFALLTFAAGGLAALLSFSITTSPFRYFSAALGLVSLATLLLYMILGDSSPLAGLGTGGVERWVAYPLLMWITGFGGHLMGRASPR